MNEDLCARENLARQQGCIEAMQDDIHELKEGVAALRKDSQETWKVVNRIEAKMDAEACKRREIVTSPCISSEPESSTNITLTLRQVIVIIAAFAFVILLLFGCDLGAIL